MNGTRGCDYITHLFVFPHTAFGPPIAESVHSKSRAFTEFLLAKIINGENAVHRSDKFKTMAERTRHEYLKDLAQNFITNTTINDMSSSSAGAKLVSTIFGSSKKSRAKNRDAQFFGSPAIKGAIVWEMSVEDYGKHRKTHTATRRN